MGEVLVRRDDGVVTVTLSAPESRNAMTNAMFDAFRDVCNEVSWSADDRVMVVTGAGDAFSSGADLKAAGDGLAGGGHVGARARMERIHSGALALHNCAKPTIAAVNGVAAGAGANLALGCDLVIATESARFIQIFAKRGLVVDYGGSWLLPRLVGLRKAKELAFTADPVSASDAERMGMINRVVPDAEFESSVSELAERIAQAPPIQLSMIKQNLELGEAAAMEDVLQLEATAQATSMGTEDMVEAVAAWMQKREPKFKGR